ncbi:hypothetical protein D3C73_1012210 [compost metagenome]
MRYGIGTQFPLVYLLGEEQVQLVLFNRVIHKIDTMASAALLKKHKQKKIMFMGLFNMPFAFNVMV